MNSSRRHNWARPRLVLISMFALLASTWFSVPVYAETVYTPEPTTIPGGPKPGGGDKGGSLGGNPQAGASRDGTATGLAGDPDGSSKKDGSSVNKGAGADNGSGTGQGSPGKAGTPGKDSSASPGSATQVATTSDDGSSPLVPILIAIAVLAAISIGAVVVRRRRGLGDPVSPNAS